MNEIVNKFLLVGDKFIPEMHLKQSGFTYSASGPFTKNKERIEKFMQTGNMGFTYKNKLDKACCMHDTAYGKSKDLVERSQSDKFLKDKAFKIASDSKYDQRGLASMVYKSSDLVKVVLPLRLEINLLLNQIINSQMNFGGRLLENSKDKKFINLLEKIFWVLI